MNLDIIPNGAIKRVHVSQNDVGRTLTFELFNNSTSYTVPSGAVVKIQGTKPSGFGFSETCTVSGNTVTVDTTEEMTDEFGYIDTELQITYSGNKIGTSNFVLAVERNPHPDTTTDGSMETIIPELTLLVNEVKGYAEEIEGTYHAYGSPWVASTVAEMTDTDKIYVYTGSETGYTNGNWYYYNGTAWVSGGVYNAVAVQTDKTLSVSGMSADAKVVGNELGYITEQTKNLLSTLSSDYVTYQNNGNSTVSINGDDITVTVAVSGTYRYVYLPVDTTNISNLTVSAESVSGTGQGYLRIGTLNGSSVSWLANGSATFVTADVSSYNSVIVAIYAVSSNNGTIGIYETYHKLQIESGTNRTDYVYPITANDIVARTSLNNYIEENDELLCNQYTPTLIDGYVNYNTGVFSTYSDSGKYKRTEYIRLPKGTTIIQIPYAFNGDAGYAFYDEDKHYISGLASKYDNFIVNGFYSSIPSNARFIVLSSYSSTSNHPTNAIRFYQKRWQPLTVACLGDSITEGMNMTTQRYVEYGGDNYPSHLQTLFYDTGYNVFVNNYGNSGEKTDAVLARLGGSGALYFGSTVTIPADNSVVDVTNNIYSSYTKALVTFTRIDYRVAIASVNGQLIRLQLSNSKVYVNLWQSTGSATQILGNAPITLGKYFYNRLADIAIVYMGINDTNTITFEEWIKRNNIVRQMFGENRTLVIGTTNAQWNLYPDIKDLPTPVVTYNQGCAEAFGDYFVNLFPIMCQQRGIDIALEGGYLADRTQAQITADNNAINAWQVPPSLTVDGTQGNVHFNNVGYYVMAKIIYDRMRDLNLI